MVIQAVVAGKVERVRNFWYDASVHKHRVKNSSNNWNHCQSLKIVASFFLRGKIRPRHSTDRRIGKPKMVHNAYFIDGDTPEGHFFFDSNAGRTMQHKRSLKQRLRATDKGPPR